MIGSYYVLYFVVWIGALTGALVLLWLLRRRLPPAVRRGAALVVAVLIIRLVLFDNPTILGFYLRSLTAENLGLRQAGVLVQEIAKYNHSLH